MSFIEEVAQCISYTRKQMGNKNIRVRFTQGSIDSSSQNMIVHEADIDPKEGDQFGPVQKDKAIPSNYKNTKTHLTFYIDGYGERLFIDGLEVNVKALDAHVSAEKAYKEAPTTIISDLHKGVIGESSCGLHNPSLSYLKAAKLVSEDAIDARELTPSC